MWFICPDCKKKIEINRMGLELLEYKRFINI